MNPFEYEQKPDIEFKYSGKRIYTDNKDYGILIINSTGKKLIFADDSKQALWDTVLAYVENKYPFSTLGCNNQIF